MIEKVDEINLVLPFISEFFPNYTVENSPYENIYCYKIGDKIVGFISYSVIYERAELNYIAIHKQYRRKGIGLINNMVENFSLEVNVNNKVAINFYLKNKFEIKATRHNYYADGDAYLMVRKVR